MRKLCGLFPISQFFAEGVAVFKVLNPCVCETLPRETLAEGVAAKHAGNEETEQGEDRADCVSEYCLLAWKQKLFILMLYSFKYRPRSSRGSPETAVTLASSTSSGLGVNKMSNLWLCGQYTLVDIDIRQSK